MTMASVGSAVRAACLALRDETDKHGDGEEIVPGDHHTPQR